MSLYLYNTLAKEKQQFVPLEEKMVRMYHCGPTVYGPVHIGNLRSYVAWDVLRRTLEYIGYSVKQVINITDVGHLTSDADTGEDKMSKGLRREGLDITLENMLSLASGYESRFLEDLHDLNILTPTVLPRASEHIAEDVAIIQALEEKDFVYVTSDGVYFDTSKDSDYGKLRGTQSTDTENRIAENTEKKHPSDFALWKFNPAMGWDSPWGKGFPGWHIECSAMSEKHLGLPFDIHTGGIDHIPVHHTNEIAQSENARGIEMARFWLHNNFLTINDEKISKSLGNTLTLHELIKKGFTPLSYRYLLLSTHYRKEVDFSFAALESATNALIKLYTRFAELAADEGASAHSAYQERFRTALEDDLNTPQALAVAWDVLKEDGLTDGEKHATLLDFDRVLGLRLKEESELRRSTDIPDKILSLAKERDTARDENNWEKADEIRDQLLELGYSVQDTPEGTRVVKG